MENRIYPDGCTTSVRICHEKGGHHERQAFV